MTWPTNGVAGTHAGLDSWRGKIRTRGLGAFVGLCPILRHLPQKRHQLAAAPVVDTALHLPGTIAAPTVGAISVCECRTLINSDVDRSPSSSNRAWTELRALAAWYRDYAETAGNPAIWASRVTTAEELEREAAALEGPRGWLDRSAQ